MMPAQKDDFVPDTSIVTLRDILDKVYGCSGRLYTVQPMKILEGLEVEH
jgi:hypothetical protein